ncbi:hypothetical protein [Cellulosimicrobium cellulans]|uniref:hypothetical protein n=1 Tax=Cellulosimicrobium cellulans TaxID=1710 RepID=UPI0020CE039F|nr:hypothetical protein NMQ07_10955 [Cellulosimicrobium cellulans]
MASVEPRAEPEDVMHVTDASGTSRARTTVPELPPSTVGRPVVEALVAEAATRRLTLVSAGPGWGKTTVAARWAHGGTGPRVAWLTLEPFDDKPAAFWADVLAALRAAGAVPPGHALETLVVPPRLTPALLRRVLAAIEALPEPVVLVLDDFHHAACPEVAATVDDLLRYRLPLHLVVLTRVDPLLRLQRLRAQGEMTEVGAAELAFDAPAVAALATAQGRDLAADDAGRVVGETGGWAVGVRLRVEEHDATSRARAARSAAEFLLAEVLDSQGPEARRFLLRTSVASAVCPDLAAVLDPGAPTDRLLPGLAAADGFVMTSGGRRTWYRYHPLLREMLLHQLRTEDPAGLREAHQAAARWFAQDGQALRALEHAAAAEDWPLLGEVFVEGAAAELAGPHRDTVAQVLRRVPYATLRPDARLHLCAGALASVDERFDAVRLHVARARDLLAPAADPVADPAAAVLLELLAASAARSTGDVRALATAAGAALAAADAVPYPFPALETYRGLARAHRAAGLAWCAVGPEPAGETTSGTLAAPGGRSWRAPQLYVLGARAAAALLAVAAGRLDAGDGAAREVLVEAERCGWDGYAHVRPAHAARAWVRYLRASDDGLDRHLAHALAADAGGREPASEAAVRLLQALVAADRGHARAARQALVAADRALGRSATPPCSRTCGCAPRRPRVWSTTARARRSGRASRANASGAPRSSRSAVRASSSRRGAPARRSVPWRASGTRRGRRRTSSCGWRRRSSRRPRSPGRARAASTPRSGGPSTWPPRSGSSGRSSPSGAPRSTSRSRARSRAATTPSPRCCAPTWTHRAGHRSRSRSSSRSPSASSRSSPSCRRWRATPRWPPTSSCRSTPSRRT